MKDINSKEKEVNLKINEALKLLEEAASLLDKYDPARAASFESTVIAAVEDWELFD